LGEIIAHLFAAKAVLPLEGAGESGSRRDEARDEDEAEHYGDKAPSVVQVDESAVGLHGRAPSPSKLPHRRNGPVGCNLSGVTVYAETPDRTEQVGAELAGRLVAGDVVLLEGELGAGKTTFVRGLLAALGHVGPVRSPTFNLVQTFATTPPVLHADLYRVPSHEGIGLEDYLSTHVFLIEWPDRAVDLFDPADAFLVRIEFEGAGRKITIRPPQAR